MKNKKSIVAILLIVVAFLMGYYYFSGQNTFSDIASNRDNDYKRTIILYVDGADLESKSAIASSNIAAIDPSEIDLETTQVLLYTGGAKTWHNDFVDPNKNQLFILKEDGFELVDETAKKSMGDPNTLTYVLNYAYNKYKSEKYDLIIADHGLGVVGAISDEYYPSDAMLLSDFSKALKNSKFNSKNKIETVIFYSCLNGTIEVANTVKDYANYLVATEEIGYAYNGNKLFSFINEIELNDTGEEIGIKFVKKYETLIVPKVGSSVATYSVIDLSKISKLTDAVEDYVNSLNLNKNFSSISTIRTNLYQYGSSSTDEYDSIDIYSFAEKTKSYSSSGDKELLNAIEDAVLYNYHKNDNGYSHGISIYFPYNAEESIQKYILSLYKNFDFLKSYYKFITNFRSLKSTSKATYDFSISKASYSIDTNKNVVSFDLTEEQASNYAKAFVNVFKKTSKGYQAILHSNNVTLDNLTIKYDYTNQFIKYDDTYILRYEDKNSLEYYVYGMASTNDASNTEEFFSGDVKQSIFVFNNDNNTLKFDKILLNNSTTDETNNVTTANNIILDRNDYKMIALTEYYQQELFNSDESIVSPSEVEQKGYTGLATETASLDKFKFSNLDSDGEYYAYFGIIDVYGNKYYSKILKIN